MIRHLLAFGLGWVVTFGFLVIWNATKFMDPTAAFAVAALIGAGGGVLWPAVVGFFLVRRMRNRQDQKIQQEVDRQVAEKQKLG